MAQPESAVGNIPFVRPYLPLTEAMVDDFRRIVGSGMLTKGEYLARYEKLAAEVLEADYALGVSSCTTGLMLLLMGLERPGEVILPSFSFVATALPIIWNGLDPVFVDCLPDTFNVDPARVAEAIGPQTRAILVTHVFGNPVDVDALESLARKAGVPLLFDAAHGFGASWRGKGLGNLGDGSAFSSTPTKLVVTGEGGIVTTRCKELRDQIDVAREYGNPGSYDNTLVGLNGRLPELNAMLGIHSLGRLAENVARRREIVARYMQELGDLPGISFQRINPEGESSYKDFAILVDPEAAGTTRDALGEALAARGIATRKYFAPAIHAQQAFARWRGRAEGKVPVTEWLSERVLCLPVYAGLDDEQVEHVVRSVRQGVS